MTHKIKSIVLFLLLFCSIFAIGVNAEGAKKENAGSIRREIALIERNLKEAKANAEKQKEELAQEWSKLRQMELDLGQAIVDQLENLLIMEKNFLRYFRQVAENYYLTGLMYEIRRNYSKAGVAYQKAPELDPRHQDARNALADLQNKK